MVAEYREECVVMSMRFIPTDSGGRVEVSVLIDGTEQWREARWERYEEKIFGTHCVERRPYSIVVPVLQSGERLVLDAKGDMLIETCGKGTNS
jgi:hypothetical protein